MTFRVEFPDVAEMEANEAFMWLLSRSPERAGRWQAGLDVALGSLPEFPNRCALAPETELLDVEVRQLLYQAYRILFTVLDLDEDGVPVRILHVRHGARLRLGEEP